MGAGHSQDISGLVAAWSESDEEALSRLVPVVYPELRRIARRQLGHPASDRTFESAALANEAYLKLTRLRGLRCESRVVELRFFGGLSVEETAEVLQVAPLTVLRDWKMAKLWLLRKIGGRGRQ